MRSKAGLPFHEGRRGRPAPITCRRLCGRGKNHQGSHDAADASRQRSDRSIATRAAAHPEAGGETATAPEQSSPEPSDTHTETEVGEVKGKTTFGELASWGVSDKTIEVTAEVKGDDRLLEMIKSRLDEADRWDASFKLTENGRRVVIDFEYPPDKRPDPSLIDPLEPPPPPVAKSIGTIFDAIAAEYQYWRDAETPDFDSAVAAALVHEAIGPQLTCVFVDTGLMRAGEGEQVDELSHHQRPVLVGQAPHAAHGCAGGVHPSEPGHQQGECETGPHPPQALPLAP